MKSNHWPYGQGQASSKCWVELLEQLQQDVGHDQCWWQGINFKLPRAPDSFREGAPTVRGWEQGVFPCRLPQQKRGRGGRLYFLARLRHGGVVAGRHLMAAKETKVAVLIRCCNEVP